jgi:hypothetical protein
MQKNNSNILQWVLGKKSAKVSFVITKILKQKLLKKELLRTKTIIKINAPKAAVAAKKIRAPKANALKVAAAITKTRVHRVNVLRLVVEMIKAPRVNALAAAAEIAKTKAHKAIVEKTTTENLKNQIAAIDHRKQNAWSRNRISN